MAKKKTPVGDDPAALLKDQATRMHELFLGNTRSKGQFDPRKERMFTEYSGARVEDFEAHIAGTMGVGVVPIQDDDTCVWAAIDIDNHDTDEDLPIDEIAERIAVAKLPLIACRSKSGGVHCYLFLEKPQPAAKVRTYMTTWAGMIGYGGSEIFPKQGRLVYDKDNNKAKGNWINLPYMDAKSTLRYARVGGKTLTLDQFLTLADKMRVSELEMRAMSMAEHPDAPPCIQKMYAQGVATGHRNEALYNIVVYHKKRTPDGYEAKAIEANTAVFHKPLPRAEMQRTITSAGRPDCGYRCNEEPIRSLCDREVCVTRKFGISSGELDRLSTVDALPSFSDLTKFMTEPVRWGFKIDGVQISNVPTEQLLDWRALRIMIADRLTRIVPAIKNQEWERLLHPLMATCRVVEAPDDASISGAMRNRLREFASKANLLSKGEDTAERKAILRGIPIVQEYHGERYIFFRGEDFVNYLRRTKSEELKGVNLWMAIKDMGVINVRLRIPGARRGEDNINVWGLPIDEALSRGEQGAEPAKFEAEL